MSGAQIIVVGSEGAKQKRLADYALPTLKKQFYTFSNVDKLMVRLNLIVQNNKIRAKPISDDEKKNIKKLNQMNIKLIKKMIS
jgi:hypothetical protein